MSNLTTNIHHITNQNFLEDFINLSDREKYFVLEKTVRNFKNLINKQSSPYDDLNERILYLLKQSMSYNDISQTFFTDNNSFDINIDSKLNQISINIVSLLYKWSDEKFKLYTIFNYSLPKSIRFIFWYLYLSNIKHHQKFFNHLTNHPQSILSPMDLEIQTYCDNLITKLSFLSEIKNSKDNYLYTMKTILSYYRSLFVNKRDLIDAEYYYLIPIILSYNRSILKSEESYEKSLAILIEMYQTFLEKIPLVLRNTNLNNSLEYLEPWFHKVEYYLQNIDQSLYNHLKTILEDSSVLVLLRKCCYTWFKYMFVGCFTIDSLLFVWDQYFITSDIPNFHDEFLPAIATAIIIILKDLLIECKKASEIESILQNKTTTIVIHQLQLFIDRYILPEFKTRIMKSNIKQINQQTNNQSEQPLNVKISPIHDLLHKITQTCNRVIHSEGDNSQILNKQTKNDIYMHKFDLKMAEREVFGKILTIDERNTLSHKQKEKYNQQILKAVTIRIQNRYVAERKRLLNKN